MNLEFGEQNTEAQGVTAALPNGLNWPNH